MFSKFHLREKLELRLVQFSATSLSTEAARRGKPLLSPDRYVYVQSSSVMKIYLKMYEDVYLIGFAQSFDIFVIGWYSGWEGLGEALLKTRPWGFCSFSLPASPRCFIFCHFFLAFIFPPFVQYTAIISFCYISLMPLIIRWCTQCP